MSLSKDSKIYVAGHRGLVGSAIWNNLQARGYNNLVGRSHSERDLTDQNAVKEFFDSSKPDGTMRKLIDVSKLHSLGWTHKVEIDEGVQKLFEWYQKSLV